MYGSVVSAIASLRIVCCISYQDGAKVSHARKSSPTSVAVSFWLPVIEDPVSEAEQALTVEHESVIVDVDAVLAPEGVKTEYDVSQALVIPVLQLDVVVVSDPESKPEQAVIVEHLPVMVSVEAVLAPVGVKTEYDVSQALVVCVEQELLELLDLTPVEEIL